MATNVGELNVTLGGDARPIEAAVKKAKASLDSIAAKSEAIAKRTGIAFAGLSALIYKSTDLSRVQRLAEQRLALSFRGMGNALNLEAFKAFAGARQALTNFGDEATLQAASLGGSFGLAEKSLMGIMPRVQDLAAYVGVDLSGAMKQVGQAVTTGANTLKGFGVVMSKTEEAGFRLASVEERTAFLAHKMGKAFGGAAELMVNPMTQAGNAVGDLFEVIGSTMESGVDEFFRTITDLVNDLITGVSSLSPRGKEAAGYFTLISTGALGAATALTTIGAILPKLVAGFGIMKTAALGMTRSLLPVTIMAVGLLAIIGRIQRLADRMATISHAPSKWAKDAEAGVRGLGNRVLRLIYGGKRPLPGPSAAEKAEFEKAQEPGSVWEQVSEDIKRGFSTVTDPLKDLFDSMFKVQQEQQTRAAKAAAETVAGVELGIPTLRNVEAEALLKKRLAMEQHITKMTERIFKDAATQLQYNAATIWLTADGALTPLGELFEKLAARTPRLASALVTGIDQIGKVAGYLSSSKVQAVAGPITGGLGEAGEVISAGAQGAAAGGPFGAILAVAFKLMSKSAAFTESLAMINDTVGEFVKALNPLVKQLKPMLLLATIMLSYIAKQLTPLFEAATPIFEALFEAVKYILIAVMNVIRGIVGGLVAVWNGILEAIAGIFARLGDISIFGKHPLGFLRDWADDLRNAKTNTRGLDDAIAQLHEATVSQAYEAGKAAEATAAETDAREALLNSPAGYKVDLARYLATQDVRMSLADGSTVTAASPSGVASGNSNIVNAQTVNIVTNDPEEFFRELQRVARRDAHAHGGSPLASNLAYAVPGMSLRGY